ncbi:MAG: ABC transporter permease [Elusimicrobiota bacterium]
MDRFLMATASLWKREMVRFLRDRGRVIGSVVPPLIFWLLAGSGLARSFEAYRHFFPGTLSLIILFTAVFSTISIIEDRKEGFLQSVLVSPAPRSSIVMGKILGSACLAVLEATLFLALFPLAIGSASIAQYALTILAMFLMALGLSGMGFIMAWKLDSTQGFHSVMNMLLLPMWILSGAMFSQDTAAKWLAKIMAVNPLTYGVTAIDLSLGTAVTAASLPSLGVCFAILSAFSIIIFWISLTLAKR